MQLTEYLEKIENSLDVFLPENGNSLWQEKSFGQLDKAVENKHTKPLIQPCYELVKLGGKRWRPLVLVLMAEVVAIGKKSSAEKIKKCQELAFSFTPLVEFCHTASLIHDDIEDRSDSRRGAPCAYMTFGNDVAINSGSWLYFQATSVIQNLSELYGLSDSDKVLFYETYLTELRRLHLGQAMDIKWHNENKIIPSIEEYEAMVKNKTGTLSRLAVKIGVICGGGTKKESEDCGVIAENIGVGFQIIDDYINLSTGNPGKKRGDDIVEGKKSLPVLLHLKKYPEDKEKLSELFEKARIEGIESSAVEEAISLLEKSGCINEAKEIGLKKITENVELLVSYFGEEGKSSQAATTVKNLFEKMAGKF